MEQWREELYHYGVKGMKWRHRRAKKEEGPYSGINWKGYSNEAIGARKYSENYNYRSANNRGRKSYNAHVAISSRTGKHIVVGDKERRTTTKKGESYAKKFIKKLGTIKTGAHSFTFRG